ncbi:MAG: YeiH family protein [Steroidobacteraceae bacterium]
MHLPAISRHSMAGLLPGLALSGLLALLGTAIARIDWAERHGFSALTLAIAFGILVGNIAGVRLGNAPVAGINFSKQALLRAGVILYGLRLTLQDVAHVGVSGVATDFLVVLSTFTVACVIGRWLGLERATAILIGAGSSICGAAAVLATEPVVEGRPDQVAVAVATVVLFGTVGIFLYPALYQLNASVHFLPGDESRFGIYVGSTVHEVAQVIAAARSIGSEATDSAVIAKMVRVMMLAPFLIGVAAWLSRWPIRDAGADSAGIPSVNLRPSIAVPWFALGFIGVVALNSLGVLNERLVAALNLVDTGLLATAMAALGLSTRLAELRHAGIRPLLAALVLFAWLVVGGACINRFVDLLSKSTGLPAQMPALSISAMADRR